MYQIECQPILLSAYQYVFLFGFNGPSRLFSHSFWAEPTARLGENGRSPRKNYLTIRKQNYL